MDSQKIHMNGGDGPNSYANNSEYQVMAFNAPDL